MRSNGESAAMATITAKPGSVGADSDDGVCDTGQFFGAMPDARNHTLG